MRVAAQALRQLKPTQFVIAVPAAPASVCNGLREDGTNVVCLLTPKPFYNVGQCYDDFSQTTDVYVRKLPQKRPYGVQQADSSLYRTKSLVVTNRIQQAKRAI
ncbi:hypothetical protein [Spirosoma oryzicola]|uniref:hypothetical protein n=1 Tax=Spirosoma oryzicola TaxID=2898794 RepID=UPI001E570A92|nr:hypothetical protein [Spirosoma oryzicola]UHG92967.1 hypothetical protein LQ777_08705 [Spirosoma oryzicola]